jgi:hypothetical protein
VHLLKRPHCSLVAHDSVKVRQHPVRDHQ